MMNPPVRRRYVLAALIVIGCAAWALAGILDRHPARAQSNQPPTISGITISEVGATSTLITWKTDKPSDAFVNYGTTKNFGVAREPAALATTHEILLDELDPSTTYYFRVVSSDDAANQSFSGVYNFTTKGTKAIPALEQVADQEQRALTEKIVSLVSQVTNEAALNIIQNSVQQQGAAELTPPRILGEPDLEIEANQATVIWDTDKEANGVVEFATDAEYKSNGGTYTRKEGDTETYDLKHRVILHGLTPETTYHFKIRSQPTVGPEGASDDRTFTTKSVLPVLSGIRITKIEETAATITWQTQVPAAALVEYTNLKTREVKSIGNPAMQIAHTIRLADLKFKTPYSVIIKARTASGEEVPSQPITFVTTKDEAPPVISQISNESTIYPGADAKIQTLVSWETDELATCQFFYTTNIAVTNDNDESVVSLPEEPGVLTRHVQVITEFTPSTAYKFWIVCRDANGNAQRSEDFVLYTPEKEKSIIDIIIENFQGTFGWVKNIGK